MNLNPADNLIPEPNTELENSNRRTAGWDIRNAPKNYLWLVLAQGSTAVFSFASVWLIIRSLGSEGYGEIVAFIAASYLIQIFVNWSSFALPRFGVEEYVNTGKITKTFWSRTFILVPNLLGLIAGGYFFIEPLGTWLKIPSSGLWLVLVHFATTALWLHIQYSLQGVKFLRLQGFLLAVERCLTFLGLLVLIGLGQESFIAFLWCYILPAVFLSIVGMFALVPFVELSGWIDRIWLKRILLYSLPLIPFALVGYLSTSQLDAIFITQYLGKSDLGIYSIATQVNGLTLQLPILANTLLLSLFVSIRTAGNDSMISGFFKNVMPTLTMGWGVLCVALSILGYFMIPIVFGHDFEIVTTPLFILLNSSIISFPILTGLATLSNSYSKTYISMVSSICTATTNILLNLLLIPRLGMIGCALATFLSSLVSLMVFTILLKREKLMADNWLFLALIPTFSGTIAILFSESVLLSVGIYIFITILITCLKFGSIKNSVKLLIGKIYAKDVSQEPSLG